MKITCPGSRQGEVGGGGGEGVRERERVKVARIRGHSRRMLIKLLARAVTLREWLRARSRLFRLCVAVTRQVCRHAVYKWNSEQETGYVNFEHWSSRRVTRYECKRYVNYSPLSRGHRSDHGGWGRVADKPLKLANKRLQLCSFKLSPLQPLSALYSVSVHTILSY